MTAVLVDTRILLWALYEPDRLAESTRDLLADPDQEVWFSAASIWEIAIKFGLSRPDFTANPYEVRAEALRLGFRELEINGLHAAQVIALPRLHTDPFDRLLVAQTTATGLTLLTADSQVAAYPGPVQFVAVAHR
ncbi:MAG: type II toxin-antitoxin system VapC family toxin [Micrococcales bacterium]|nr:type II toxin-antitoxin system VapC family toxin [Micrococcales bacterium]